MFKKLLTTAMAAAFTVAGQANAAEDPVKIGFSISKTGIFAQGAASQMTVYELWRDQIKARGGLDVGGKKRPIKLVWYDDESNPSKVAPIYEKLITDDKVDLLLAPWGTPMHLSVAPVAEKYKFPIVGNTAASVALRQVNPGYIWFVTSSFPDRNATEMAKLLKQQGFKSAAIIANVLPFAQENQKFLIPALKAAGIAVKINEKYPPNISDMTSLLTKVKKAEVDAVIVLSYPADSFLYMKQSKEIGIKAPFQFLLVGPAIPVFRKAFGADANGIVAMGHWSPLQKKWWPRAKEFAAAYTKKFNSPPDYLDSSMAYMSLEILEQVVAKTGLDKEKMRALIASGTFQTVNGPVKFKGVENELLETGFLQIQKGDIDIIWPESMATSKFQKR
ncbi:MAG: amino acid ABC transporter substrate-binding protein [Bauldia litoralis]